MYPARLIFQALGVLAEGADIESVSHRLRLHASILRQWQARYDGMTMAQITACQQHASSRVEAAALAARKNFDLSCAE